MHVTRITATSGRQSWIQSFPRNRYSDHRKGRSRLLYIERRLTRMVKVRRVTVKKRKDAS